MKKSKIGGIVCLLACLALVQSCGQRKERTDVTDNQEVAKKVQRPIIVEIEDERDVSPQVVAPIVETPVAAAPVGIDVPMGGIPMGPIPMPFFPPIDDFEDEPRRRDRCDFAASSFSVTNPDLWYTINTTSYPNDVPLSLNGNHGFDEGDIVVTPTGLTINRSGDYWVNMTAILSYAVPVSQTLAPVPALGDQFIIPVYVVRNGVFDPNEEDQFGGIGIFPATETHIENIQGNGIMANIKEGTRLSIVAMNSGSDDDTPIPLQVLSWSISLHRICD